MARQLNEERIVFSTNNAGTIRHLKTKKKEREEWGIGEGKEEEEELKWIIGLNVKPKRVRLLEQTMGENLCNLGLDKGFFDTKKL